MTNKIEIELLRAICKKEFSVNDMFFSTAPFYYISGLFPNAKIVEVTDAITNIRESLIKNTI